MDPLEQVTVILPFEGLPWMPDSAIPLATRPLPTVGATLQTLNAVFKTATLSPHQSPLTPILDTQTFQLGFTDSRFDTLIGRGSFRLLHFSVVSF